MNERDYPALSPNLKYLEKWNFKDAEVGDLVRHLASAEAYVVTENYGRFLIVTRTNALMNPDEWLFIKKTR